MTVSLEIRDGSPHWWLSPDIWAVPGTDPNGPPGTPVVGQTAYLWAHVENHGSSPAMGTRIDFWWADPSAQILRSTAHFIGSAFADLPPGGQQDVLCLVPWSVALVNGGHECLLAVANHPGSSVPNPPPDEFGPTLYPEVAQRNIDVVVAAKAMAARMIAISAGRRDKHVRVSVETGGELDRAVLERIGLKGFKPGRDARVDVSLSTENSCDPEGEERLDLKIPAGTRVGVYAHIAAKKLAAQEYALVHVLEHDGDRLLGGCSFAVVAENPKPRSRKKEGAK